jgi:hypothetical protein
MSAAALTLLAVHNEECAGLDKGERLLPTRPEARKPGPEEAICRLEPRPEGRPLIDGQLMPQSHVLQPESFTRAERWQEISHRVRAIGSIVGNLIFGISRLYGLQPQRQKDYERQNGIARGCPYRMNKSSISTGTRFREPQAIKGIKAPLSQRFHNTSSPVSAMPTT